MVAGFDGKQERVGAGRRPRTFASHSAAARRMDLDAPAPDPYPLPQLPIAYPVAGFPLPLDAYALPEPLAQPELHPVAQFRGNIQLAHQTAVRIQELAQSVVAGM